MLNRPKQKRYSCFIHYFLFASITAYCFCISSGCGIREELIPTRNVMLSALPEESQAAYQKLMQMLDGDAKKQLEKAVYGIKVLDVLDKFIKERFQNYMAYIDLLKVLPEDQSIALKNEMDKSTNLDKMDQLIALRFPKSLRELDGNARKNLFKLPARKRQDILAVAMKKEGFLIEDSPNATTSAVAQQEQVDGTKEKEIELKPDDKITDPVMNGPTSGSTTSNPSAMLPFDLDIKQLVNQKVKEAEENPVEDDPISQDGWGEKLPLQGKERDKFLRFIMEFKQEDQELLKALFDKAEEDSIKNFLSVYDTGFAKNECSELLATLIYLYKGWPALTIKLCNSPNSLSGFDKLNLFQRTNSTQLNLLKKLESLLS